MELRPAHRVPSSGGSFPCAFRPRNRARRLRVVQWENRATLPGGVFMELAGARTPWRCREVGRGGALRERHEGGSPAVAGEAMSCVLSRHPTEKSWVSFQRRGGQWEPYSVNVGTLQSLIQTSLPGLTGRFTFSERGADQVRAAIAHEPADLARPELANVSMTVLQPPSRRATQLCYVRRPGQPLPPGQPRFRDRRLFSRMCWASFDQLERPSFARELLARPTCSPTRWCPRHLKPQNRQDGARIATRCNAPMKRS